MSVQEHQRLLEEAESLFPVTEWTIGGIRIWPFLRIMLSFMLAERECGLGQGAECHPRSKRVQRLSTLAWSALDAIVGPFRDPEGRAPIVRKADVFAFTCSAARQAKLSGRYVDTLCEPLYDELRKIGRSSHTWEFSHIEPYRLPRASRSYMIQRNLLAIYLLSFLVPRRPPSANLPTYAEFCDYLRLREAWFPRFEPPKLVRQFSEILSLAEIFERALRKIDPVLVVTSNMSRYEMALYVACRRLGIVSVEIQHGVQGDLNGRYAGWTHVPADGFELLPHGYWCWDPRSARAINGWSDACAPYHHAVAGGNPWLEYCHALDASALRRHLTRALSSTDGSRVGLVTLPYPAQAYANGTLLPEPLVEAMAQLGRAWIWWIRFHPLMKPPFTAMEHFLRAKGIASEVRAPTELPLFALLPRVAIHLTHSSSTVLDANLFGVRSVVWTEYGRDFFREAIAEGYCAYAGDTASLLAAIRDGADRGKCTPRYAQPPISRTLTHFLELSEEWKRRSARSC